MQRSRAKAIKSNRQTADKQKADRDGRRAEALAALYLRCRFHSICHMRYKTPLGEIDIISKRGNTIYITEVKYRNSSASLSSALEMVSQQRLVSATEFFISRNPALAHYNYRFDIVFISKGHWPKYIKNAFSGRQ